MSKTPSFYITTTLPYVNASPHIGFAMEIIRADIIARWKELSGHDVFFNTGTDEHGQKIWKRAEEEGLTPEVFADKQSAEFKKLLGVLNIKEGINFVRTTDSAHVKSAQEFWKKCFEVGDIYKKNYKVKYCVGCELEKTESELVEGKCPIHPNLTLEIIDEENYFFRFSKYQAKLLELYKNNPDFITPASRQNEITKFVERGLEDFSISRVKSKMPWGITVPGDEGQVMYVWFDALVNYISVLEWPEDKNGKFKKYWLLGDTVQYAGKDNLRQQSAMWQAMLMSAGLPPTKHIVIDGFITSGGQKMSKSLGNTIDPFEVVEKYGTDALRYYVAREIAPFEDGDFTWERFKDTYNANLANGIGNLTSRVMKMAETYLAKPVEVPANIIPEEYKDLIEKFDIQKACDVIWKNVSEIDQMIQTTQPFKLVKTDKEAGVKIITDLVVNLQTVGTMLAPILPETSEKILSAIKANKMPEKPLFARKEA